MRHVFQLISKGKSQWNIAKVIHKSLNVIYNLLKKNEEYGNKKRNGKLLKISSIKQRKVFRMSSNEIVSLRDIQAYIPTSVCRNQFTVI